MVTLVHLGYRVSRDRHLSIYRFDQDEERM
jgi:hypothetical protein